MQVDDVGAALDIVVDVLFNLLGLLAVDPAALLVFFVEDLLCYWLYALILVSTLQWRGTRYTLYLVVAALVEGLR